MIVVIVAISMFGCNAIASNEQIKTSSEDDISTMNDIARLQSDLKNNGDLRVIQDKYGVGCVTRLHNNITFNLVRYDANPIGFGTLERTWTFLQIVNPDGSVEVYTLYEKSAEYSLNMEISELPNGSLLIEVAGSTNISRGSSAFVDYWEYGADGLKEYSRE